MSGASAKNRAVSALKSSTEKRPAEDQDANGKKKKAKKGTGSIKECKGAGSLLPQPPRSAIASLWNGGTG